MIEHFSTCQVLPQEKRDFWNALVGQTYDGLVVDPLQPQFHAHLMRWHMGPLALVRPKSAGAVVARRSRTSSTTGPQRLALHIVQSGTLNLFHRDREVQLSPGDMAVCASEEYYRFDVKSAHDLLVVELDRSDMEGHGFPLDDLIGTRIPGSLATTRLLRDFMLSLWREGLGEIADNQARDYADVLIELVRTSLRAADAPGSSPEAARFPLSFERMKTLILSRYRDPDFTPARMALELGVTLRTLQLASARAGWTPHELLSKVRLEAAAHLLSCNAGLTVAEAGYACGYADPAYFARRFRLFHGQSPTEYRQRH